METSTSKKSHLHSFNVNWLSGMITGAFVTGLFNPWDRALYLLVKHEKENRSFFMWKNFQNPYQGVNQALVQRTLTGGLYFSLKAQIDETVIPYCQRHYSLNQGTCQFISGSLAGALSGFLTNGLSAVKYHNWGKENIHFFLGVKSLFKYGGAQRFFTGTTATVSRDLVFGSTYEVLRFALAANSTAAFWLWNGLAAVLATIMSSPFNYIRSTQYAIPPGDKVSHSISILKNLAQEITKEKSVLAQLSFLQNRLRTSVSPFF